MWSLYQHAKQWTVRPSELAGLTEEGDYYCYCFDEAVSSWGNHITNELDKIEGKTDKEVNRKRKNKLLQLIQAPDSVRFKPLRKPTKRVTASKT